MNCTFLSPAERAKLLAELEQQFGITSLPSILLETGKEKIRAFSGSLSQAELEELGSIANVEIIGLYVARKEHDLRNLSVPDGSRESKPQDSRSFRLSFDATHLLALQLSKNIVDISGEQRAQWLRGNDLDLQAPKGTVIIRCGTDFLGCGKSTGSRIVNHVPKERRLRK